MTVTELERAAPARLRPLEDWRAASLPADALSQNAMSVDVEEYFQVQALAKQVTRSDWEGLDSRVAASTNRILDLFAERGVKSTFFTLGWVAERQPDLIRRIVAEGHELGSHGYEHIRADSQTAEVFRQDIRRTKAILEDTSGVKVKGYRAATFSIGRKNLWAFEILAEEGYRYSSSIYPVHHDFYGMPEAPRRPFLPFGQEGFTEIPITTVKRGERTLPCGGGGYFRLLPYLYSRWAIARHRQEDKIPANFYFHPWEIDADQPRVLGLSWKSRLRHYSNLSRMEDKLRRLTQDFRWGRMDQTYLPEEAQAKAA